jgi:hypothetical protein
MVAAGDGLLYLSWLNFFFFFGGCADRLMRFRLIDVVKSFKCLHSQLGKNPIIRLHFALILFDHFLHYKLLLFIGELWTCTTPL